MSMTMDDLFIGIDVGGTNIKVGVSDPSGNLVMTESVRTGGTQEGILSQILGLAEERFMSHVTRGRVRGIGVAVPGAVDIGGCIAIAACNLPWRNMEVGKALMERFGLPVRMEKDTDAGALGELRFGMGKGMGDIVYMALGTGVGGGVILGGELHRGRGGAGEIGHMIVRPDGPECKCGSRGCLEAIASSPAIAATASKVSGRVFTSAHGVFEAAEAGDPEAAGVVDGVGSALACVLLGIDRLLAPEAFILGGGVAKAGGMLMEAVEKGIRFLSPDWGCARILLSRTADWSGVLGAAATVAMHVESSHR